MKRRTAQRSFSGRCFHEGIAPRPVEIFQNSSPSLWSCTRAEVQSAGLGLRAMAAGPLPLKVSPWQGTQLALATERPNSTLFGSPGSGFFLAFSAAGTTHGAWAGAEPDKISAATAKTADGRAHLAVPRVAGSRPTGFTSSERTDSWPRRGSSRHTGWLWPAERLA